MAFTPPTTYASQAQTGYYGQFSLGSGSPPVYTPTVEVKTYQADYYELPDVPRTHLLSPNATEEVVGGLMKPGTVEISGNFIGDATQLQFLTFAANNAAQNPITYFFKWTKPVQNSTKTYTVTGTCFIKGYNEAFENSKMDEFKLKIQITGIITQAVA